MNLPTPTKPEFTTERLVVFKQAVVISEVLCAERTIYVSFLRNSDTPRIIATMLVTELTPATAYRYLDWISTDEDFRRQGYAEEMWRGLEKHLGEDLMADGASKAGDALCEKMEHASTTN